MRIMAQMAMVMNLDKCIGCHTCSVTCKQAWTNRTGTEYVWFNNVETRPGQGYPRGYEDQQEWKGGWTLNKRGRLALKGGGRLRKLLTIFSNPKMPSIQDYYEPCPYKKIYFNHRTGKAEKCTFCYPRIEVGLPTVCAETCVGRLRYIGLMLYDADKVLAAAATDDEHGLYEAQRDVFLDPDDPDVQ